MEIVIRATVVFFFLWLLVRALGKRELAEMSAFELVLLVVMGDIVQQGITEADMSATGAVLAAGTLALWILQFSYLSFRSRGAGRGRPGRTGSRATTRRGARRPVHFFARPAGRADPIRGAWRLNRGFGMTRSGYMPVSRPRRSGCPYPVPAPVTGAAPTRPVLPAGSAREVTSQRTPGSGARCGPRTRPGRC